MHPKHPLGKHKRVTFRQLQGMNFVAFARGIPTRKFVDDIFSERRIEVKVTMEFDNIETLKKAVEVDAGISIVPLVAVKNEVQQGTLKALAVSGETLYRPLGLLLLRGKPLPLPVSKFIDILLK